MSTFMQSSMSQQLVRRHACGLQRLQLSVPAVQPTQKLCRKAAVRSTNTTQQQVQEQQQELLQQQQPQPQAVALQRPSKAPHPLMAALPQPLQRGIGAVSTALEPARQAVSGVLGKIDPRVRGLILLNAMTLLMGSNWVVVKESNDAWDPVSLPFVWACPASTYGYLQ